MDEPTPTHIATRSGDERVSMRPLERGEAVGRYLVIDRVGAGAMGVVYAAYDPELDRRVALKVLHHTDGDGTTGSDAARLRREAQALAKLSHPAVVAVHDVGSTDGRILAPPTHAQAATPPDAPHRATASRGHVFIAMEFVDGRTLTKWRTEAPRSIAEVLAVMREAGRGLAAAHAAGLLHRDFKPDNVMIDRTGRVRVMDFGLARASARAQDVHSDRDLDATQDGVLVGTPAYMSPEQLAGAEIDARADQFAFAVTLWELCYGTRPFAGTSLAELATNVIEGRFGSARGSTAVPAWLRRVLVRALAPSAADRYPSMDALLDDLGRDPMRTRRRAFAIAGVLAVGGGAIAWQRVQHQRAEAACVAEGAQIDEVWNDDARAATSASIIAAGATTGASTWEKIAPRLDDYAERWRATKIAACRAETIEHTRNEELTRRAAMCLDQRRWALAGMLRGLAHADRAAVVGAVITVSRMARIDACSDERWLWASGDAPRDPAVREALADVHRRLFEASAEQDLGAYALAEELATGARDDARALGVSAVIALAELRLGIVVGLRGDRKRKSELLQSAYFVAGSAGADEIAIESAIALVYGEGHELAHPELGLAWGKHAEMMLDRMNEPEESVRRATLAFFRGTVLESLSDYDGALREQLHALALRERIFGGDHPEIAASLGAIGNIYYSRSEYETAVAFQTRALALREEILGVDHPYVASSLNNLAIAELALGADARASEHFRRAADLVERELGPDHPDLASELNNLGVAQRSSGDLVGAGESFARAAAIWRKSVGPDHPDLAVALDNLGINERRLGQYDAALQHHREALALRERTLGADHRDTGVSLAGLGAVELALGHAGTAILSLERAAKIAEQAESDAGERGHVHFLLARALYQADRSPTDHARARSLVGIARDELRSGGDAHTTELAELEAWAKTHP